MVSDGTASRTLVCIGTSHRIASVRTLERTMRAAAGLRRDFETSIADGSPFPVNIAELVVLSTCNRVEVYAVCGSDEADAVLNALAQTASEGDDVCDTVLYAHRDLDAVRHLCRVASGIESLVVGEPQISGQVTRAFAAIAHRNGSAPFLSAVARTAKLASRRARAETGISRKPASVSSVAVHVAASRRGGLDGARVLIVGAGKIGRLSGEALRASGAVVTIVNRTLPRAEALAARVGARAASLQALPSLLAASDVVITSTASPHPIIDAALVSGRRDFEVKPLLLVDIAVPRNIDEDVSGVAGVDLIGIDDLRGLLDAHMAERRDEIPRVEAIIEDIIAHFRPTDGAAVPLIGDLRRRAERIRHREIERALRGTDPVDATVRIRLEQLSRSLVNKLLHDPTSRLRAASERGEVSRYETVVRDLFALDDTAGASPGV